MKSREDALAELQTEIEVIDFRLSLGDYFADKNLEDIPEDLVWEDGMDEPEIGDPRALKGGVFRTWMPQFPGHGAPLW